MSNHKPAVLDMTKGNSVRMILTFAIFLFVGNIFQQVFSMVVRLSDYCFGYQSITAIGAASSLYGLICFMFVL